MKSLYERIVDKEESIALGYVRLPIAGLLTENCNVLISNNTPWADVNKLDIGRAFPLPNPEKLVSYVEYIASLDADGMYDNKTPRYNYMVKYFDILEIRDKYFKIFFENRKGLGIRWMKLIS